MTRTKHDEAPLDETVVKDLLLWARREGIVIEQVTVGSVTLVCRDTRVHTVPGKELDLSPAALEHAGANLYEKYGGQAMDELAKANDDVIEDDDD
jgi:hypothetical protein